MKAQFNLNPTPIDRQDIRAGDIIEHVVEWDLDVYSSLRYTVSYTQHEDDGSVLFPAAVPAETEWVEDSDILYLLYRPEA